MNLSRVTSGHIESHFDRSLDEYLSESPKPIMAIQECKNGAYRDVDANKFVTWSEYDERQYEHSQACECGACNE